MDFCDYERVTYEKSPLVEVLFQIRFPHLLDIEDQLPTSFQKDVKEYFPYLEIREEILAVVQSTVDGRVDQGNKVSTVYDFYSTDRNWKLSLGKDFVALLTSQYSGWERFKKYSKCVIDAFLKNYDPKIFIRVGLRYKNVIDPKCLGFSDVELGELLDPRILGFLHDYSAGKVKGTDIDIKHFRSNTAFDFEDVRVLLQNGLVTNTETKEIGFLIDLDYSSPDREMEATCNGAVERLERYHACGWKVFRACISEKLHESMVPTLC